MRRKLAALLCIALLCAPFLYGIFVDEVRLTPLSVRDLPAWSEDQARAMLNGLQESCEQLTHEAPLHAFGQQMDAEIWQALCIDANDVPPSGAQAFIESSFTAYRVSTFTQDTGLLTGYFTPTLNGSRNKSDHYSVPVYAKPDDDALRTRYSRAEIEAGALGDDVPVVLWLEDAVDAFFMHIQGSAYVDLPNGARVKLVYAGKNEFPYTPIGAQFVERGVVSKGEMSMQWLKDWLYANPDQAAAVMQRNASYIFFQLAGGEERVYGASGAPLTPHHSIAIDPAFLSYGLPLYLDSHFADGTSFTASVIAQDTGSAIRGALRADLYLGVGDAAASLAGPMKSDAAFYVLLPKSVLP